MSIAHVLAAYFLPLVPLLLIQTFYLCAEIACLAARARSDQGSRMAAIVMPVSEFSCATSLSLLSLALSAVAATLSVAILVTALSRCIIVRTAWIPLGLVTALPFVVGLVLVIIDLVPVAEIAPVEVAIGATALTIGALYVGKGIWEMSATRQRLMEANEAVQAASRERSRFFAAVSHEIRTPLNDICGMAKLIAENEAPELSWERANLLLRSAQSLNAIVSEFLTRAWNHELATEGYLLSLRAGVRVADDLRHRAGKYCVRQRALARVEAPLGQALRACGLDKVDAMRLAHLCEEF